MKSDEWASLTTRARLIIAGLGVCAAAAFALSKINRVRTLSIIAGTTGADLPETCRSKAPSAGLLALEPASIEDRAKLRRSAAARLCRTADTRCRFAGVSVAWVVPTCAALAEA